MFTSAINAEVTRKHDAAAHDVPFKAARPKRVPDPTAVEQLPIIYEEQQGIWLQLYSTLTRVLHNKETNAYIKI